MLPEKEERIDEGATRAAPRCQLPSLLPPASPFDLAVFAIIPPCYQPGTREPSADPPVIETNGYLEDKLHNQLPQRAQAFWSGSSIEVRTTYTPSPPQVVDNLIFTVIASLRSNFFFLFFQFLGQRCGLFFQFLGSLCNVFFLGHKVHKLVTHGIHPPIRFVGDIEVAQPMKRIDWLHRHHRLCPVPLFYRRNPATRVLQT
ncbi:unnamed protein product [Lactuca saligna]|uniref:Uncharacterized protein n=1 Tax=Lactuca saligna TaxID=75948 RepID=A0AA35ZRK8_LACSI|nr:unnamed protein product [Lactuca saligna]